MNLFSNLFTAETVTDLFLVKFGLLFSLLFFIPFLSTLIGSMLFSLLHFSKGKIYNNNKFFDFAEYTSNLVLNKLWITIIIGILPFVGIVIFFSQLFNSTDYSENLFFALLIYFAGLFLSITYKRSFLINVKKEGIERAKNTSAKNGNVTLLYFGGWIGFALILLSSFILVGYIGYSINFSNSLDLSAILFTNLNIINYMLFFIVSLTVTSAIIIVRLNKSKIDYEFKEYALDFSSKSGILFSIVLPLLFVLTVFSVGINVISFAYFFNAALVLILMLLTCIQFYLKFKGIQLKSSRLVLTIIFLIALLIYNGQLNSENLNQKNEIKSGRQINIYS